MARGRRAALAAVFLIPDLAFFGANIVKVPHGGWFPLVVAAAVFTVLTTWRRGREILDRRLREEAVSTEAFARRPGPADPGACFRHGDLHVPHGRGRAPLPAHNLKHNKVLHERVVFLTVATEEQPRVPRTEWLDVKLLGRGSTGSTPAAASWKTRTYRSSCRE